MHLFGRSTTEMTDLHDDVLCSIFSWLSPNQLLPLERVNKMWKRCVAVELKRVPVLRLRQPNALTWNREAICNHQDKETLTINYLPSKLSILKIVLKKCPNIRCFHSFDINLTEKDLTVLANRCKKIECLSFRMNDYPSDCWFHFIDKVGKRLLHLNVIVPPHLKSQLELVLLFTEAKNVKKVNLKVNRLTLDKLLAIEQLNETAFLNLDASFITSEIAAHGCLIGQRVDQLTLSCLDSIRRIGNHFQRLSKLKLCYNVIGNVTCQSFSFPNLKSLEFKGYYFIKSIHSVVSCSMPQLEELSLMDNSYLRFSDSTLGLVLNNIKSIKRLKIISLNIEYLKFSFLKQLNKLEEVKLAIIDYSNENQRLIRAAILLLKSLMKMTALKLAFVQVEFRGSKPKPSEIAKILSEVSRLNRLKPNVEVELRLVLKYRWLADGDWQRLVRDHELANKTRVAFTHVKKYS